MNLCPHLIGHVYVHPASPAGQLSRFSNRCNGNASLLAISGKNTNEAPAVFVGLRRRNEPMPWLDDLARWKRRETL